MDAGFNSPLFFLGLSATPGSEPPEPEPAPIPTGQPGVSVGRIYRQTETALRTPPRPPDWHSQDDDEILELLSLILPAA